MQTMSKMIFYKTFNQISNFKWNNEPSNKIAFNNPNENLSLQNIEEYREEISALDEIRKSVKKLKSKKKIEENTR